MRDERLGVSVTFDERHGYVASASELRWPVVALSLGGLRARSRSRCCLMTFAAARRPRRARTAPSAGVGAAKFDVSLPNSRAKNTGFDPSFRQLRLHILSQSKWAI